MDANEKLNKLIRVERFKQLRFWCVTLAALFFALFLVFQYRYSEVWSNEIVSGTVSKIIMQPSDGPAHFVIEIDLDGTVVFISEFFPPDVNPGDQVQVRITSNESRTKNKYFRLRDPRT